MSYTSSPDISITHTYLTALLELYCALKTHSYVCAFSNVRFPHFVHTLDQDASDGYQPVAHVVRNIFRSLSSAVWSGAMWGVERRRVEEKGIRNGVICPKAVWRARVIALSLVLSLPKTRVLFIRTTTALSVPVSLPPRCRRGHPRCL